MNSQQSKLLRRLVRATVPAGLLSIISAASLQAQVCNGPMSVALSGSGSGQPLQVTVQNITPDVCNTASGSAQLSVTGGTPGYTYLWSTGSTQATASGLSSGNHTVTVTDLNNCSVVQTVNIPATPATVTISTTGTLGYCMGTPVNTLLQLQVVPGASVISRQWQRNSLNISGATAATFTATSTGNYRCIVTTTCGVITSNTIAITNLPSVVPIITPSGILSACAPATVTMTAVPGVGSPPGPYQWQWVRSNTISGVYTNVPGATTSVLTTSVAGYYRVEIQFANGCRRLSDARKVKIDECGSIAVAPTGMGLATEAQVRAFPNPFQQEVTIEYQLPEATADLSLGLYDVLGRLVHDWTPQARQNAGLHRLRANLSHLPAGAYYCRLRYNQQTQTITIVHNAE